MRTLLASAAILFLVAGPATAESGRGYLTSIERGTFLCAGEGGFELRICAATERRLRFYVVERTDAHLELEIQLAASGACVAPEGGPAPGAHLTTAPCERQLWRYDLQQMRLTYAGLCLEAQESAQGARAVLASCAADAGRGPLRQEWAIATDS